MLSWMRPMSTPASVINCTFVFLWSSILACVLDIIQNIAAFALIGSGPTTDDDEDQQKPGSWQEYAHGNLDIR